jgi:hypothetical protein
LGGIDVIEKGLNRHPLDRNPALKRVWRKEIDVTLQPWSQTEGQPCPLSSDSRRSADNQVLGTEFLHTASKELELQPEPLGFAEMMAGIR